MEGKGRQSADLFVDQQGRRRREEMGKDLSAFVCEYLALCERGIIR